eukprot:c17694_g1_i1.p1 GENE.c17694_g1_i1~~c17694_g1_i1.p1  ORF type:complete len:620 (-),score=115.05 c17694_g1_i1:129-1988(-)
MCNRSRSAPLFDFTKSMFSNFPCQPQYDISKIPTRLLNPAHPLVTQTPTVITCYVIVIVSVVFVVAIVVTLEVSRVHLVPIQLSRQFGSVLLVFSHQIDAKACAAPGVNRQPEKIHFLNHVMLISLVRFGLVASVLAVSLDPSLLGRGKTRSHRTEQQSVPHPEPGDSNVQTSTPITKIEVIERDSGAAAPAPAQAQGTSSLGQGAVPDGSSAPPRAKKRWSNAARPTKEVRANSGPLSPGATLMESNILEKISEPSANKTRRCSNGDTEAEMLLDRELRGPADVRMGTELISTAPDVCSARAQALFCRFSHEWHNSQAPSIPRYCPMTEFPDLETHQERCPHLPLSKSPNTRDLVQIAYVVLVHNSTALENLPRLLEAILDPTSVYVVHADKKGGNDLVQTVREMIPSKMEGRARVIAAESVYWGSASILRAYVACLRELLDMAASSPGLSWDYVINLSAEDYPIRSQIEIRRFLTAADTVNFLDMGNNKMMPIPIPNWANAIRSDGVVSELSQNDFASKVHRVMGVVAECPENSNVYATLGLRRVPENIDWREGSFWHILHYSFVSSLLVGDDAYLGKELLSFFENSPNPDETFFQTAILNSRSCKAVCPNNFNDLI